MAHVDKSVPGWVTEYKSPGLIDLDGENFYLRMVTTDMDPNDTLYMEIPAEYETKPIARVIEEFFPADTAEREKIKGGLETEDFPELPEIYDYFADIVHDARRNHLVIDYAVQGGPISIDTNEIAYEHLSLSTETASREMYKILHLILDLHNKPFGDYEDQAEAAKDQKAFRGLYFYYLVHKQVVTSLETSQISDEVEEALNYCEAQNLVKAKKALLGDQIKVSLTQHGKEYFRELYDEAAYYTENFEIFSHVYAGEDYIRFNHVEGADYRIQVMRHEGVNVYRAVMVMSLMNGTFDPSFEQWESELRSDTFFPKYLGACADTDIDMSESDFRAMIEKGKALIRDDDEL
ncbi:MAG: hypothetical protein GF344_06665 [Chitinivibrionales bacterium]|nr:hypothetical protein [Chitinivibrionales bacterium]MBD3356609.1 hypothetical protein [Chitinivibrionales bacterium]